MKIIMLAALLLTMCLSAGCSQYWYQEGSTFDQCDLARTECRDELLKRTDLSSPGVDYAVKFMDECMAEKGYRKVTQDELPFDAKRAEPDTSLHWRTVGLAGTVE